MKIFAVYNFMFLENLRRGAEYQFSQPRRNPLQDSTWGRAGARQRGLRSHGQDAGTVDAAGFHVRQGAVGVAQGIAEGVRPDVRGRGFGQ